MCDEQQGSGGVTSERCQESTSLTIPESVRQCRARAPAPACACWLAARPDVAHQQLPQHVDRQAQRQQQCGRGVEGQLEAQHAHNLGGSGREAGWVILVVGHGKRETV